MHSKVWVGKSEKVELGKVGAPRERSAGQFHGNKRKAHFFRELVESW